MSIFNVRQRSCGKVKFLQVCVILFREEGGGGPMMLLPVWSHVFSRGMMSLPVWSHVPTGVSLERGSPFRGDLPPEGGVPPRGDLPSEGISLQRGFPLEGISLPPFPTVRWMSGRYATYWNAFLLYLYSD